MPEGPNWLGDLQQLVVVHCMDISSMFVDFLWACDQSLFADTPRKFNIAPENRPSLKESSLPTHHFSGAMSVLGRVSRSAYSHTL